MILSKQPWMDGRDGHAAKCVYAAERSAELGAQLAALEAEELSLLSELNAPGFREQRHRAAGRGRPPSPV